MGFETTARDPYLKRIHHRAKKRVGT